MEYTLTLGTAFPDFKRYVFGLDGKQVISYGACQFPTLGSIVEGQTMEIAEKMYMKG